MSLVFSPVHVMTVLQHNTEARNPSGLLPPRPHFLCPDGKETNSFVERSDDTSLKFTETDVLVDSDVSDNDAAPLPAVVWHKRRSRRLALKYTLDLAVKAKEARRTNRQTLFSIGTRLYSIHKDIAPLEDQIQPGYARCKRIPTYGAVVKQSEFFPQFWLVRYNNGTEFYCTEKAVHFIDKLNHVPSVGKDSSIHKMKLKKMKQLKQDCELIMTQIVCSKMIKLPGWSNITYESLTNLFKPEYPWLTPGKLRKHVHLCRKQMHPIEVDTWLHSLPAAFGTKHSNNDDNLSSKCSDDIDSSDDEYSNTVSRSSKKTNKKNKKNKKKRSKITNNSKYYCTSSFYAFVLLLIEQFTSHLRCNCLLII